MPGAMPVHCCIESAYGQSCKCHTPKHVTWVFFGCLQSMCDNNLDAKTLVTIDHPLTFPSNAAGLWHHDRPIHCIFLQHVCHSESAGFVRLCQHDHERAQVLGQGCGAGVGFHWGKDGCRFWRVSCADNNKPGRCGNHSGRWSCSQSLVARQSWQQAVTFHIMLVGVHQIGQGTNKKASDFSSHIVSVTLCPCGNVLAVCCSVKFWQLVQVSCILKTFPVFCDHMCPQIIIIRQLLLGVSWAW